MHEVQIFVMGCGLYGSIAYRVAVAFSDRRFFGIIVRSKVRKIPKLEERTDGGEL